MNNCPKCGSYIPDGKLFCPACGRVKFGASKTARDRVHAERARTMERIQDAQQMVKRDAWLSPKENNPYRGGTYEQHKSHDPNSEDYYKSKYEKSASNQSEQTQNLICAAAYFGFFFFLPLVTLPNSPKAKFHANQGLVLFIFNVVVGVLSGILSSILGSFFEIFAAVPPLLMVYGAANAFRGYMKELPIIGKIQILNQDNYTVGGR